MNFKDQIQDDISNIFLNEEEFAEDHNIDGQQILCIIDEDKSISNKNDGVFLIRRSLFVKESDLGYRPVPDQKLNIDGEYFYVMDCLGSGLLEVVLEAYRS